MSPAQEQTVRVQQSTASERLYNARQCNAHAHNQHRLAHMSGNCCGGGAGMWGGGQRPETRHGTMLERRR